MSGDNSMSSTYPAAAELLPQALLDAAAYPHPVDAVQLIETHMSWLFLTGEYVYKVKKPVRFDFVDFSSLAERRFFCLEELRLNAGFAPDLYLAVVPVLAAGDGTVRIGPALVGESPQASDLPGSSYGDASVNNWAVQMRQFDTSQEADVLVAEDRAAGNDFREFGELLAVQHGALGAVVEAAPIAPAIIGNFDTMAGLQRSGPWHARLEALKQQTQNTLSEVSLLLDQRAERGYVRECHGDLHLSNMVAIGGRLLAFDALEFSRELRVIDVWNDAAFLIMDCLVRGRGDLAYAFIDGYLDGGADYDGLPLLPVYLAYRSMVRAKVAALSLEQAQDAEQERAAADRLELHLGWVEARVVRAPGLLLVTCGVSGSGKSYWAKQLVSELGAVRLRSDVLRKQNAGLAPQAHSASGLGSGLYDSQSSAALYVDLCDRADALLRAGENVIVDATSLRFEQRERFLAAAEAADAPALVLHMQAAEPVLRRRIRSRRAAGTDASEADESVLSWQLDHQDLPGPQEPVLVVDTETVSLPDLSLAIRRRVGFGP